MQLSRLLRCRSEVLPAPLTLFAISAVAASLAAGAPAPAASAYAIVHVADGPPITADGPKW